MEPLWTITLFGELTLRRGEMVVQRFRSQKVADLLGYLALPPGRAVSREILCEMLWPGDDPAVTRNRLRVTLASLRRQLEPPGIPFGAVLETRGNGEVRLRSETVVTDVALFEAAAQSGDPNAAARLYTGRLLPNCYEEWALREQDRLEELAAGLHARKDNLQEGHAANSVLPPVQPSVSASVLNSASLSLPAAKPSLTVRASPSTSSAFAFPENAASLSDPIH